jgi:hypothetical protein
MTEENAAKRIALLETIRALESVLLAPGSATMREDFEDVLAPSFEEVGASGRRYSRKDTIDTLMQRASEEGHSAAVILHARCIPIHDDSVLFIYTLAEPDRITRRVSLWRREEARWRILYHQGTNVQELP